MVKKAVLAGALTAFNGSWKSNQAQSEREQSSL
jgi:hypothetical protein